MDFNGRLRTLQSNTRPLVRLIHLFESTLADPELQQPDKSQRGFRYLTPDIRHFCLLKAIRAISAFNASLVLCEAGFTQEICVLLRTIVECTSHIDFVLSSVPPSAAAEKFIADYFADIERGQDLGFKSPSIRQGQIHAVVGAALDSVIKNDRSGEYQSVDTSKLHSKVYLTLSNYVHCKYPEVMDLYGGAPGRFHLRGMRGTPKDVENIEILETYFTSISHCLHFMVLRLGLVELAKQDQIISAWMRSASDVA